ncbi:hypothetical protein D3C85_1284050 [compost metagenome]
MRYLIIKSHRTNWRRAKVCLNSYAVYWGTIIFHRLQNMREILDHRRIHAENLRFINEQFSRRVGFFGHFEPIRHQCPLVCVCTTNQAVQNRLIQYIPVIQSPPKEAS